MARITNNSGRGYGLPRRVRDEERVQAAVLMPGASRDVPEWYVDELRAEEGLAALLDSGDLEVTGIEAPPDEPDTEPDAEPEAPQPRSRRARGK